jgi:hypothetical protein
MDKITFFEATERDGTITEFVLIDHGNDQFTSMPKSEYDKQQANQNNPVGGNI